MHTHAVESLPISPSHPDLAALIRAEYLEMPGLSVTLAQAARLWHVDRQHCFDVLEALTREGLLRHARGCYVLAGDRQSRH
jgi:DNA-binding IscR family transcriptional regulator